MLVPDAVMYTYVSEKLTRLSRPHSPEVVNRGMTAALWQLIWDASTPSPGSRPRFSAICETTERLVEDRAEALTAGGVVLEATSEDILDLLAASEEASSAGSSSGTFRQTLETTKVKPSLVESVGGNPLVSGGSGREEGGENTAEPTIFTLSPAPTYKSIASDPDVGFSLLVAPLDGHSDLVDTPQEQPKSKDPPSGESPRGRGHSVEEKPETADAVVSPPPRDPVVGHSTSTSPIGRVRAVQDLQRDPGAFGQSTPTKQKIGVSTRGHASQTFHPCTTYRQDDRIDQISLKHESRPVHSSLTFPPTANPHPPKNIRYRSATVADRVLTDKVR